MKPWETLASLDKSLKRGGKIAFAGEPINEHWWKHWGLRLDIASVYCIRKFGWFESGWTLDFLGACFSRNGWQLNFYPHLGLDGSGVGIAHRIKDKDTGAVRPDIPSRPGADGGTSVSASNLSSKILRMGGRSMRIVGSLLRHVRGGKP